MAEPTPQPAATPAWSYAAAVVTAFCWSGNWIVGRGLHDAMTPIAIAQWRWIVAGCVFLPFTIGGFWRQRDVVRQEWPRLLVIAAIGVVIFNTLIYWGLKTTTAINGSLFNSAQPVLVIIIGWVWFAQPSNLREILGVLVSLLGVVTIITRGDATLLMTLGFGFGDLIILVAVAFWSLYSVLIKAWPTRLTQRAFLASTIVLGLPLMLPFYAADVAINGLTEVTLQVVVGILWLAIVGSLIAYLCWNYAVRNSGAARASVILHLIPVFTAVQAAVLLGEQVQLHHLAGMGLILSGIYIASAERPLWRALSGR